MTREDKKAFHQLMATAADIHGRTLTVLTVDSYYHALNDLPLERLRAAFDHLTRTGRFFPKPAELREAAGIGMQDAIEEGVLKATEQARKHGYYGKPTLDPPVMKAVIRVFGSWSAFCQANLEPPVMKRFRDCLARELREQPPVIGDRGRKALR